MVVVAAVVAVIRHSQTKKELTQVPLLVVVASWYDYYSYYTYYY